MEEDRIRPKYINWIGIEYFEEMLNKVDVQRVENETEEEVEIWNDKKVLFEKWVQAY